MESDGIENAVPEATPPWMKILELLKNSGDRSVDFSTGRMVESYDQTI